MRMSHEWSRWESSDIDGQAKGRDERERTSQHERANGRGWVDNHQDCPEGELRGQATLVKITERSQVRRGAGLGRNRSSGIRPASQGQRVR